ncbi:hypothetical protein [Paenibacillus vini]|uniref:Uncharacterized protein n=1 Tax=Paenibacillus vini TaxID=1476024 RepID=A0ABQ4MHP8_9BACL|nr:hypothetical protein [Paenibacillus vini]MDN4069523.1 hypothetical protein [Paenibacillus vini]GIP55167.1 hypothetical protein J42TS3_42020 [Paenibacillus vini]
MSYNTELATEPSRTRRTSRKPSAKLIVLIWILLIGAGGASAYLYSNHLKESMMQQLDANWQAKTEELKADYTAQLSALSTEVNNLQSKVETFNELLEFTKDNTTDKTDNSNKLYTQLSEVKKQLAELQKKMDLLK